MALFTARPLVQNAAQVEKERAVKEQQSLLAVMPQATHSKLSYHIAECWTDARDAKRTYQTKMLDAARMRRREYSPAKLAAIRSLTGGSEAYIPAANLKCTAAHDYILDIYNSNERPYSIKPTPQPSLPYDLQMEVITRVQQEVMSAPRVLSDQEIMELDTKAEKEVSDALRKTAEEKAEKMTIHIDDILVEGGWIDALAEVIDDIVTYPAGILKGPVYRIKPKQTWTTGTDGNYKIDVKSGLTQEFDRVSPFDFYPQRNIKDVNDGYCIERLRLNRRKLNEMKGLLGYNDSEIDAVLTECGRGGIKNNWIWEGDIQADEAEERDLLSYSNEGRIDGLEFWGSVPGQWLLDWGMSSDKIKDPTQEYQITAILIGTHIIRATVNQHPLGMKPYHITSWRKTPGAFWGQGIPDIIEPIQEMLNAVVRALVNNCAIACLTGDTIVYRQSRKGRGASEITLNELFDKKEDFNSGLRRICLRSLDENSGQFFSNRIVDIFDNGVRPIYEVLTENGYRIKATLTHRFMNSSGEWAELSTFNEGDDIAVNGSEIPRTHKCIDCGTMITAKALRCKKCHLVWHNKNQEREASEYRDANATTARQRKACKDARRDACELCGSTHILEVHHKDRDPWNNEPENLICLCDTCHKYEHKRHDNLGDPYKHKYVDYDKIISIKHIGSDRVFDLQMTGPNHNFVANGFISHNSGPQVGMDVALLPVGTAYDTLIPWQVHKLNSSEQMGMGQSYSSKLPIEFFQPTMQSEQLLRVISAFMQYMDEYTGIPAYTHGVAAESGAGATSSGLAMLMTAAGKIIKNITAKIDMYVVASSIRRVFENEMQYYPDNSIKGDAQIVATGSGSLIAKEQQLVRRLELLDRTRNDIDMQIIGLPGRAEMLKEVFHAFDLNLDHIIPDVEELMKREEEAQAQIEAEQLRKTGNLTQPAPRTLDASGQPVSGQDQALFVKQEGAAA
jgi:hypothetical protein